MDDRELRGLVGDFNSRIGELQRQFGKLNNYGDRQPFFVPVLGKLTGKLSIGAATATGGKYTGQSVNYSVSTAPWAGNLSMPEGLDVPSSDDVTLFLNLGEDGAAGHVVASFPYWCIGLFVGRTTKGNGLAGGLPIVVFRAADTGDRIGKVKTYTAGTNTVVLTPCNEAGTASGDADVTCSITLPASRTVCSIVDLNVGDVLAYRVTGSLSYLTSVPLPKSVAPWDTLSVQAISGLAGFNNVRLKA